jgi:hypothetical protein
MTDELTPRAKQVSELRAKARQARRSAQVAFADSSLKGANWDGHEAEKLMRDRFIEQAREYDAEADRLEAGGD